MSKQSLDAPAKRKPGRPKAVNKRATIINVKVVPEYKTWLSEFAEHVGLSVADTIGMAVSHFSDSKGFRPPPKR